MCWFLSKFTLLSVSYLPLNCNLMTKHFICNSYCFLFAVLILAAALVVTSGAPVNSIQEKQPWLSPCSLESGSDVNIPADILRGITVPRIPEWDDPSKFAFETLNILVDTEDLVGDLMKYMVSIIGVFCYMNCYQC